MIQTTEIEGGSVYGVRQMEYTVDGREGQDFGTALTAAAFRESTAIEQALAGYSEIVRQRERKVEDLGELMAYLNGAVANLKVKDQTPSDMAAVPNWSRALTIARTYGIQNVNLVMSRDTLYKTQNQVQYAMDREDNDLKQDMVALQSLMSKRDNAYSSASRLIKKANDANQQTIGNIQ